MSFIIRHETDGYVKSAVAKRPKTGYDGLSDLLGGLSLSSEASAEHVNFAGSKLRAKAGGHEVPIASTLEIKTRTRRKPLAFDEAAPQLWVSQTPNLVRAYHDRGTFAEPKVENVSARI